VGEETHETESVKGENDEETEPVEVEVYIVTGTENLRLPERFCEECNLFVNSAKEASGVVGVPVEVEVCSWWTHIPSALRHGGYHPPVMIVGAKRLSQGHHVPSTDEVAEAIRDASDGRDE